MSISKKLLLTGVSMILAVGLAACDKKNEEDKIGSSANDTHIERDMDEAANKIDNKMDQVGEKVDDATITAKVKAAIFAEPGLSALQINVDTVQNVVTLTGSVDSQQNSDRAKEIAGAVAGVTSVVNNLVVKSDH